MIKIYDEWFTEGYGKGKAHHALHTSYVAREKYPDPVE
ncbi:MAG: iron hydrogenase small subunit [Atopobiaceae bacterium]|nr:iron hydrogenase small subunit [Atopobiaceae bacterium]